MMDTGKKAGQSIYEDDQRGVSRITQHKTSIKI